MNILTKRSPAGNISIDNTTTDCFCETFAHGSTALILLNFCAENVNPQMTDKLMLGKL